MVKDDTVAHAFPIPLFPQAVTETTFIQELLLATTHTQSLHTLTPSLEPKFKLKGPFTLHLAACHWQTHSLCTWWRRHSGMQRWWAAWRGRSVFEVPRSKNDSILNSVWDVTSESASTGKRCGKRFRAILVSMNMVSQALGHERNDWYTVSRLRRHCCLLSLKYNSK